MGGKLRPGRRGSEKFFDKHRKTAKSWKQDKEREPREFRGPRW